MGMEITHNIKAISELYINGGSREDVIQTHVVIVEIT